LLSLNILGDATFTDEQQELADVNGDGEVSLPDLPHLKQYIMKDPVKLGPVA